MKEILKLIGLDSNATSHTEKWVSGIGGFCGILFTVVICRQILGADGYITIASMGASTVILFALPHVPVAQPWSLVGGQVVSAIVGVTCARYIPDVTLAASVAVGGAILVMYYSGCIHPPGGATALAAVIGGANVHALGYNYVVAPILITAISLLLLAIVINYPFKWRRYPVHLTRMMEKRNLSKQETVSMFTSHDLQLAMKELDLLFDVSEEDLTRLVNLAVINYKKSHLLPSEIRLGKYYSNGKAKDEMEIRHVVDESSHNDAVKDMVIYKLVGVTKQSTSSAVTTRVQFAKWAKHEVQQTKDGWEVVE
jgi:CBS domain-containing membrane protein